MSSTTIFVTAGSTSVSTDLPLVQNAASTSAGDPILGLAYNTANLVAYSHDVTPPSAVASVSLATQTAAGAWSSGGFVKLDDTHAPGLYRFDIPNALLTTAGEVNIEFSGAPAGTAGNMEAHIVKIFIFAFDLFTTLGFTQQAMTESYAAKGAAPTLAQILFLIQQLLTNFSWSGTTQTVTKLDGSTTAATLTANSSSNATSLTRAT